uniref:Uncharacterized protein n=1 Tax=Meloidogyne javanica TaxID=6303 RepID=A0A915LH48_MELJA
MVGVYDWLSKQEYSFGIAEFNSVLGALAVFEALGIENTFNVSAVPFIQGYLQYLGIDTLYNIPGKSRNYRLGTLNCSLPKSGVGPEGVMIIP